MGSEYWKDKLPADVPLLEQVRNSENPADVLIKLIARGLEPHGFKVEDALPNTRGAAMLVDAKGVKLMIGIQVCR